MRILVTGATGFIGSRLAEVSVARGHEVIACGQVNTPVERERRAALEARGIPVVDVSVTDRNNIAPLTEGCNTVFHLAAAQHEANVPDEHFQRVNVEGTRNVLDACVSEGVERVVHGSTIGVYGGEDDVVFDEHSPPNPENIYGRTKLEAEGVVLSYGEAIPISIIRISETYGPGDRRLLKLFKAIRKGLFLLIGEGSNIHQPIYVDDLIDGLFLAATKEEARQQIYVLAGAETISTREMAVAIANAVGAGKPRLQVPKGLMVAAAAGIEKTLRPLGIQPPLHRRRLDFFIKSFRFSQSKAANDLGFSPRIGFTQGAVSTARWYEARGWL